MKVPSWFTSASGYRKKRRHVVLLAVPLCADCRARMSATPTGLRCFGCGGSKVKG